MNAARHASSPGGDFRSAARRTFAAGLVVGTHVVLPAGLLLVVGQSAPAPLWLAWACIDAAWLLAEAGQADAAAQPLEKLPAALAGHPNALAASARVRQAGGDTAGARVAQQACLLARGTHANDYLLQLGEKYEAAASAAALPPVPMLPSRL